ncbi:hypothetical protein RMSM_06588 [Rhodopirellula maiorica SM1]|uniref:Uncharacterized protein n=1 Tax=Rhodopirellula maiorica SM1 TaxID=1265738 RepID=M5RR99_9BACT|nr:hypothetical protein RMSM_06588 [Rhodopirellula maiorica SM1]
MFATSQRIAPAIDSSLSGPACQHLRDQPVPNFLRKPSSHENHDEKPNKVDKRCQDDALKWNVLG